MRNYRLAYAGSFILIAKTLKGINLITNTPLKYFYTLYKMRWNIVKRPIAKDALGFLD
ncbi:hypothetical protein ACLGCM_03075 [Helicobacter pylori]